ncbi:MAG: hypothetical protein WBA12_08435 [Catalinimonas sp.]
MRRLFLFLITCALGVGSPAAQDLFDLPHTLRYADYLQRDGRWGSAQVEYRRALRFAPGDTTLVLRLMRSYRLDAQPGTALLAAREYFPDSSRTPRVVTGEYLQALLDLRFYDAAYRTAGTLPGARRDDWRVGVLLMQHRWNDARAYLKAGAPLNRTAWEPLVTRGEQLRYKKPWLATALSVVVPGSGRAYAGRWVDGGLGLLNVGIFTWQAYRGFNRRGAGSFYGWFNAFFGASFYIGNLYGSHRAAVIYNDKQNEAITRDVERLLRSAP